MPKPVTAEIADTASPRPDIMSFCNSARKPLFEGVDVLSVETGVTLEKLSNPFISVHLQQAPSLF